LYSSLLNIRDSKQVHTNTRTSKQSSDPRPTKAGTTIAVKFAVFIVLVFIGIFVMHQVLQVVESSRAPPGELHTVGFFGQKLHLYCTKPDKLADFVVLFHHGLLGSSADWYSLQHQLKQNGIMSCSYDRPGMSTLTPNFQPSPILS